MVNKRPSDYLDNKVCHNSLSQYGQVNSFFSFFVNFFVRLKNTIPQLLHLYFFGLFIDFFLSQLYISKPNIINNFCIFGGFK